MGLLIHFKHEINIRFGLHFHNERRILKALLRAVTF